ncbi:MAG: PQQ-dependent sugar dehydrogenase [Actinomycetota bacterium]|nr:PQQ-dependent sugar dehydrogenase [Actinomycetota bacterium]
MHMHPTRLTKIAAASAAAVVLVGAALAAPAGATAPPTEPPAVALTLVAEVGGPVDLTWRDGDAALYVVGQGGTVSQVAGPTTTVVLDITDLTTGEGERGLLGLAFSPAGDLAYVNFTDLNGDTNIAEFAVDATGVFNRDSLRTVLTIEQPYANHNGGDLAFGPDGMLYIGMGDGGDGGDPQRYAQNLESLLGKMLRIDPATPSGDLQYTVPADNPFVGQDGALGEIWSVGLRNPWRFSFDAETGDLWIADVGQSAVEEIDVAPADGEGLNAGRGLNFGWSGYEGNDVFNSDTPVEGQWAPIHTYPHDGRCSISGGVRGRGEGAGALAGWYVYADYCTGQVFALPISGEGTTMAAAGDEAEIATTDQITALVSGPTGELYVLGGAGVQRIDPA